ncbi:transcriptional regulator with XRE-family HTH domain [Flavobacterium arsenatis]|uniref:Transcriptional regulator with XRE-family HTH domain n=1 Tax=Flavobacterium arsenatis TaxID=1484332 RepID=A0ABU1TRF8_9FLAO|nr:helix-turn-helix transcriptional regulator [Flavobacterium arsenatis]MDR6968455.1 transcriptional regulator with XRE-family HTH domain [Flavobacterium arsenatis]
MVNTDDFIKRLEILMEHFGMNASSFADKIGVQRSSISHLLSGRNKPSLDFVMKIMDLFPEVNLYWILNGKGNLLKDEVDFTERFLSKKEEDHTPILTQDLPSEKKIKQETEVEISKNKSSEIQNLKTDSDIFKIVFFYKDGTFKDFNPS